MDTTLSTKIATGSKAALIAAKTLITTPTLINPGNGYFENQTDYQFLIPLETETHRQSLQSDVSESLVICRDQKKNISDNIAPGSYTWTLSGYIPGSKLLEMTNYWTPIVKYNTSLLKMAAEKGYMLVFKDIDNTLYKRVVIQSLDIETQKDCRNKTPFSMTLKQINVMSENEAEVAGAASNSIAELGSILGSAKSTGVTVATDFPISSLSVLI